MLALHKEITDILQKKFQGILPTTMLLSLLIINSFVSTEYMEFISDMKCQIHCIHLEQYYIQQKYDQKFQYLCQHYCVNTSVIIYSIGMKHKKIFNTTSYSSTLELCLFFIRSLTIVLLEERANIQYQLCTKKTVLLQNHPIGYCQQLYKHLW